MSRTRRADPGGCWMRYPHHIRAEKELQRTGDDDVYKNLYKRNRKPIPPDSWCDLLVSYWRGQEWGRR